MTDTGTAPPTVEQVVDGTGVPVPSLDAPAPAASPAQSGWLRDPIALLTFVLIVVFLAAFAPTVADPDLWGHVRFGGDIVRDRSIAVSDPYSFTSDRPWVNHEWLAEVLMYQAYHLGGPRGLVALKVSLAAASLLLVVGWLRRSGLQPGAQWAMLAWATVGWGSLLGTMRPQAFSVALFTLVLATLAECDQGRKCRLWRIPPVMALWVNLHGGWIVGAGAAGAWMGARLLDRRTDGATRRRLLLLGACTVAATLANPYGSGLWLFLWQTVSLSRPDIVEWRAVVDQPVGVFLLWAGTTLGAGALLWRLGRATPISAVATLAPLAVISFRVSRTVPFFAAAAALLLAGPVAAAISARRTRRPSGALPGIHRWVGAFIVGVTLAVAAVTTHSRTSCIGRPLQGDYVPPDGDAARFVTANGLHGRMVTWFNWGEYAIWHLSPQIKVSMDGRRETVYSSRFLDEHNRFYGSRPDPVFPDRIGADFVWLPSGAVAIDLLVARGWAVLFRSPVSVVLGRNALRSPVLPAPVIGERCFPGP